MTTTTTRKLQTRVMDSASVQSRKKKFKKVAPPPREGKPFRLLHFQTYDHTPEDEKGEPKYDQSVFYIQMFGIDEAGTTCTIFVNDMQPFFYIQVGEHWNARTKSLFKDDFTKRLGRSASAAIVKFEMIDQNKLYDFTGDKTFRFIKITFKTIAAFNRARNLWYERPKGNDNENGPIERKYKPLRFENTTLILYESKIPPLLRYFHLQNISPSGWVEINDQLASTPDIVTTTCDYEFVCSLHHIKSLPVKETPVPYKIACFDIEASSSHGDFPLPVKNYKRLVAQLVDSFQYRVQTHTLKADDKPTIAMFLKKAISSAFGINGTCSGIDLVYPKETPNKTDIKKRIDLYLKRTIEDIVHDKDNAEGKAHLKITTVLEKMAEDAKTLQKASAADEDGDGGDQNETDVHPMIGSSGPSGGFGSGIGESNFPQRSSATNATGLDIKPSQHLTAVDVLGHPEFTREQKINSLNVSMTTLFPPLKGDEITFFGTTFMKYGEAEPYKNHCLVVGTCDQVPNTEIVSVKTETAILESWAQLIQNENPDIVIGYNIFGFDYEFMFQRSRELKCIDRFMNLSRIIGEKGYRELANDAVALEQTKNRLASGDYDLHYPRMSGRLQIDLLFYFRRDYNLSSYKLDDVAGTFIRDDIKHIELSTLNDKPVTRLYSKNLAGLHVDDFMHIEITSFTTDYYAKGKKFKVLAIDWGVESTQPKGKFNVISVEGHYTDLDPTVQTLKWGMAKDDVTPQDIFRLSKESATSRAIVAKYCIQDCNLVHHLMKKTDVLTGYIEMSRICSVPISFLVFRGQGIKLTSYVAKVCSEKNTLMPDLERVANDDGYEGAIVLPPKCNMYGENPVACNDYSSLYPSIAKGWNLSPDSKVWTKTYDLNGKLIKINDIVITKSNESALWKQTTRYENLPGYKYIVTDFDNFETVQRYTATGKLGRKDKVKSGKKVCCWAQFPDSQEGIIPNIIGHLLKARKETRVKAESEKDPFIANVLDKRQLGYKVTANSLYGQMGSSVSTFFEKDVAASITATGRKMITYAKRMVEEIYGNSVYKTENGTEGLLVRTKSAYVYGDSVANYTPVTVRVNGQIQIVTIEELGQTYGQDNWVECKEEGKQTKEYCELSGVESWTEQGWTALRRIIRHPLASHKKMMRVLTHTGLVDVTDDHSLVRANGEEVSPVDVEIGTELLHHPLPEVEHKLNPSYEPRVFTNQLECARYCHTHGSSFQITTNEFNNEYTVNACKNSTDYAIKKLHPIEYSGYVYDLTTENHHFAAGIGNMIVHNTDSVFFTFNFEDPETGEPIRGKKALELTIEVAQESAYLCSLWLPPPMKLAYEKTLMSFILLSKKRYVGMLYETDPNKGKLKFMGLPLKRRDSCDYLKDVYGGILTILMKEPDNIQKAIEFLTTSLQNLIDGKVSMEKLAITKSLRSDYKNPGQIAHKVLADRIGERDPGNKPKPGDRIKFVFVNTGNKKALLGERIETPEFILQNSMQIDYTYYITNQLMNPLQQMFGLALEKIFVYKNTQPKTIRDYRMTIEKLDHEHKNDLETFMKKREKYCSTHVKQMLFDPFLTEIYNKQNGVQTLFQFYKKKK